MTKKILLTSFTTWLPHQQSNSSDDLLNQIDLFPNMTLLRHLPVDVNLASDRVISKVKEILPDAIVCCGMAEGRNKLTIESNATCAGSILQATVNLDILVSELNCTEISHEAGKFVCEGLYYSVLNYLQQAQLKASCIFVHVPILTTENISDIVADFKLIVQKISG